MSHGLLWMPLLLAFVVLAALGWAERRRQSLFRSWAEGSELFKLDACGMARLRSGQLTWGTIGPRGIDETDSLPISTLQLCELMADRSGEAPLTEEAQGPCRLRLVVDGRDTELPFADASRARSWVHALMSKARCEL
ncbi:MAG: hypothetical protein ERJ69_10230 [Aphanocapsa feldmannii 288cV]|nr:MAG: hypothetical protein ERJ69_10230 [Aphanocapsa feldmannii 288cV]